LSTQVKLEMVEEEETVVEGSLVLVEKEEEEVTEPELVVMPDMVATEVTVLSGVTAAAEETLMGQLVRAQDLVETEVMPLVVVCPCLFMLVAT
jgi:hypothetical protein